MKKSKPPKIDLTGYRYAPALPAIELMSYALITPIWRLRTKENRKIASSLTELTVLIGVNLENEQYAKATSAHQNRMRDYSVINVLIFIMLYLSIAILMLAFIVFTIIFMIHTNVHLPSYISGKYTSWITTAIFLLIFFILVRLAFRVTNTLLDRYYADSLAYTACLNLLIHLMKENSLMLNRERQHLLIRIRGLRRYLILLSYQYPTGDLGLKNWAHSQFQQMVSFILEKESQIIAPLADTQSKMIAELHSLLVILLTAQYGEFNYTGAAETETSTLGQTDRRSWLLKSLGLVSPLLLLAANFFFKDQFQAIGFDNQVVALIGLAWFLLAIDANLNLGIVDRISGLAKAMRELR